MFTRFLASFMLAFALAGTAGAASVRPLQLDEIIDSSAIAFQGTCTGNRTERDPATNFVVTYTTFSVKDVLKGSVGSTHVIKQIGGKATDGGPSYRADGVPTFVEGEDYVVLLAGVSSAGFSSPIGLAQGKFDVLPDPAGAKVSNGRDFGEMTSGIPASDLPASMKTKSLAERRSLGLDDFKQLVRARAARPR